MSSPWVKEPASGRYYYDDRDQYGRTIRVWEDAYEAESSARSREPADRQYGEETPRQLATNKPTYRTSQYQSSTRSRRESETSTKRSSDSGNQDPSRPVAIRKERTYHDDGGYDRGREGSSFHTSRSNDYVVPRDEEERIYDSSLDRSSNYRHPRARDGAHESEIDPLEGSLGKLTLSDVNRDGQYTLSSSERREPDNLYNKSSSRVKDNRASPPPLYESKGKSKESGDLLSQTDSLTSHHIRGTRGETEKLDKSYIVRRHDYQKFFKPGRIFSTLWTDPYGGTANESENSQFMTRVDYVSYGERVHTKIRRFVVVRQGDRCCTCLPVTTYDGKGYKKRGIKLHEHGLIYSESHPGTVEGITKKALHVTLSKNGERLRNPSYINYGRIYTVDTNVKVKDVGELDPESRRLLTAYYKEVNFPPDDDYDSLGTKQTSADALVGVGSGEGQSQDYSGSQVMVRTPSMVSSTVVPSEYTARSHHSPTTYGGAGDSRWGSSSGSNPMAPIHTSGRMYDQYTSAQHPTNPDTRYPSLNPLDRKSSSSGYQQPDSRYSQSSFPGAGPVSQSYPIPHQGSGPIYSSRENQYLDSYQGQQPPFSSRPAPLPAGGHYATGRYQESQSGGNYGSMAPNPPAFVSQSRGHYPPPSNSAGWAQPPPAIAASAYEEEEDDLRLPTLEEAKESRRRRDSVSGRHRQRR